MSRKAGRQCVGGCRRCQPERSQSSLLAEEARERRWVTRAEALEVMRFDRIHPLVAVGNDCPRHRSGQSLRNSRGISWAITLVKASEHSDD